MHLSEEGMGEMKKKFFRNGKKFIIGLHVRISQKALSRSKYDILATEGDCIVTATRSQVS